MSVVVGYSAKPEGRAALVSALTEAKLRGTELIVVPNTVADELDTHRDALEGAGVSWSTREAGPEGGVADHLLQVATDATADLIVIGLRRRSPTGKLLLGMNAQRVLLDAGCPVLAVKADD